MSEEPETAEFRRNILYQKQGNSHKIVTFQQSPENPQLNNTEISSLQRQLDDLKHELRQKEYDFEQFKTSKLQHITTLELTITKQQDDIFKLK